MRWISAAFAAAWLATGGPAAAQGGRWPDYQIIVWQPQTAARQAGLRRLGVTGGAIIPNRDRIVPAQVAAQLAPFAQSGLRPYLENVATDLYAPYHRWTPDHPVTWLFEEARRLHAADPSDPRPFMRLPSLSDPAAFAPIHDRLVATVRAFAPARPIYYSLGDETGIADLSANWDFDLSPGSLAAMRVWLAQRYGGLDTLNAEWGTQYARWDDVQPMLTTAAMARADDNFAAWSDFKEFMDASFAHAVRAGADAVHEGDPAALAAIEGAQVPGWGGYDYARLAHAADVMEIYPGDANMEIAHALNPDLILLTTAFGGGPADQHAIWDALLAGARGLVLWDEAGALVDDDGAAGPLGRALAPLLAELLGPAGAALLAATAVRDPVAILYSPASFRVQWLLDHRAEGEGWTRRDAEAELQDTPLRAAMRGVGIDLLHLGLQPNWVASDQLEHDALSPELRVLILPHAIALGDGEVAAIRRFAAGGGTVLADVPPGGFDGHGRRRMSAADFPWTRLDRASLPSALAASGVAPRVRIVHPDGTPVTDATVRLWRDAHGIIVAVQRDAVDAPAEPVIVSWARAADVTDLRRTTSLGNKALVPGQLEGSSPILFEVTAQGFLQP